MSSQAIRARSAANPLLYDIAHPFPPLDPSASLHVQNNFPNVVAPGTDALYNSVRGVEQSGSSSGS